MRTVPRLLVVLLAAVLSAAVAAPAYAAQRADVDFTAIVALDNCSGSVFRLPNAADDDPALVFTDGHCIEPGMPSPGQVVTDQPSDRTFQLLTKDRQGELGTLNAERLVYATMTDTYVTVYRLTLSYAELRTKYDVDALRLSGEHPVAGHDIDVVSGFRSRIYSCAVDGFVYRLREGGYTWQDSLRYTPGCDTTVVPDARYGQETYELATCLNPAGRTTLHRRACVLPG